MEPIRILVVDDDDTFRMLLGKELSSRGHRTDTARNVAEALEKLGTLELDVALIDLRLPDGDGLEVVRQAQKLQPRTELIVLTGHGTIDTAIEAIRLGAFDYLRKPCPVKELQVVINKAVERQALVEKNSILRDGLAPPDMGDEFVGSSPQFQQLCTFVQRVAGTDSTVLILGETGVGKGVLAKLIHARSARARQPLVVVECAALHEDLLDNELFGHDRGAYTGATHSKHGLFEVAHQGTILLDEIGDVSLATQVKLLRVLETGCFRHVGGTRELRVDVRLLAATNHDLQDMMERGYFRRDLYYRINTINMEVPPLRERPGDIPTLVEHFTRRLNARFGQQRQISPAALERLCAHAWPGNVRELLHVMERAMIMSDLDLIEVEHLPPGLRDDTPAEPIMSMRQMELRHIKRALGAMGGNRGRTARILGISERTLYRKIKEYDLQCD